MIGWLIFGGIVLLIVILLALSATVVIDIEKDVNIEVKYFLLRILAFPEKLAHKARREKRQKKKAEKTKKKQAKQKKKQDKLKQRKSKQSKKKNDTQNNSAESNDTKQSEQTKADQPENAGKAADKPEKKKIDFEIIKGLIDSSSPPVKRMLKKIRVSDVYIDIVVGGEDSAKVALTYGSMYALICPVIEWLKSVISVKVEELNIEADFEKEKTDYFVHAKAKLRLSTAIGCALWLLVRILKNSVSNQAKQVKQPVQNTGGNKNGTAS